MTPAIGGFVARDIAAAALAQVGDALGNLRRGRAALACQPALPRRRRDCENHRRRERGAKTASASATTTGVAGAWLSVWLLPAALELAALAALLAYAVRQARKRRRWLAGARLPFAAFLAPAIWLVWLYAAWTRAALGRLRAKAHPTRQARRIEAAGVGR